MRIFDSQDSSFIDLPEGFKLRYRGKKTANDYWLNFSRCATLSHSTFFFVSDKEKIVAYSLKTVEHVPKSSRAGKYRDTDKYEQPVYGHIQNFAADHKDLLYVLTEDARIILVDYADGSGDKLKEVKIDEQTVSSTMYTDVACGPHEIVVAGYREEFKSNTFVLFNTELECLDTIEAIDKTKTLISHHIHKMEIFTRNSLSHLLAMNISCTVDLLVIHENKFHPVALNRQVSEGKEN